MTDKSIVASEGGKKRWIFTSYSNISFKVDNLRKLSFLRGFSSFSRQKPLSRLIKKHFGLNITFEFDCEFVRVFPQLGTTLTFRKRKEHSSLTSFIKHAKKCPKRLTHAQSYCFAL